MQTLHNSSTFLSKENLQVVLGSSFYPIILEFWYCLFSSLNTWLFCRLLGIILKVILPNSVWLLWILWISNTYSKCISHLCVTYTLLCVRYTLLSCKLHTNVCMKLAIPKIFMRIHFRFLSSKFKDQQYMIMKQFFSINKCFWVVLNHILTEPGFVYTQMCVTYT